MTQEEIERDAMLNLSNYDGQGLDVNGEMYDNYDGGEDPYLDFAGISQTFADAISRDTIFTITITNTAIADRECYLFSGYRTGIAGLITDGAFNDTGGNAGLSATGQPQTIEDIKAYINFNPSLLSGFKVSSNVTSQIETTMITQRQAPWRVEQSDNIFLAAHTDENNFNDKVATVDQSIFLDNQQTWKMVVSASSKVTITLFFGVSLNTSKALEKKANRARRNIVRVGAGNIRRNRISSGAAKRLGS